MKPTYSKSLKKILFYFIILCCTSADINAQNPLNISGTLNNNFIIYGPDNYVDRSKINIIRNPTYVGPIYIKSQTTIVPFALQNQHRIDFSIDKSKQLDIDYLVEASNINPDPQSEEIDYPLEKLLPVGSIAGSAQVTSSGSASYGFSIYTPPGTNGMVPQIGISYGSSNPNGILGRGWNINGISSITRVSKTIYHNGIKEAILLNPTDPLALDGNRLIAAPSIGPNKFRPEKEDFSLISSETLNGAQYFTVITKAGLIMEYGYNANARLVIRDQNSNFHTHSWFLNKVSDNYGNYMTYSYNNFAGEITLREISYTGTATFAPYNFIRFYYDKRKDTDSNYIAGICLRNTQIVREIEVFCEGKSMKRYKFKYVFNSQSYLREIAEYGSDNTHLNSTFFKYGAGTTGIVESKREDITPAGSGINDPVFSAGPMNVNNSLIGDFNGDGLSDQLAVELNTGSHELFWNLFLNRNEVFEEAFSTDPQYLSSNTVQDFFPFIASPYFDEDTIKYFDGTSEIIVHNSKSSVNYAQAMDMNGDGMDDLVLVNSSGVNNEVIVYFSNGRGFKAATPYIYSKDVALLFADINGDGLPEGIIYYRGLGTPANSAHFTAVSFDNPSIHISIASTLHTTLDNSLDPLYKNFRVIDYDGDGRQDVMAQRDGVGTVFMRLNLSSTDFETFETISTPMNLLGERNQSGDFNGDGIIDFIHIRDNWWTKKIEYGTGKGFITSNSSINVSNYVGGRNTSYLVFDVNGDGKDDLIRIVDNGAIAYNMYVNYGGMGSDVVLGNIPRLHPSNSIENYSFFSAFCANDLSPILNADFDGDGRQEIYIRQKGLHSANSVAGSASLYIGCSVSHFNKGTSLGLMVSANNGFRNKTQFTYKTLSNCGNSIYTKGSGTPIPKVVEIQTPQYVVTKMESPNQTGGTDFITYKYEGLKMHREGLGILGFDKMTTINSLNNSKSVLSYYPPEEINHYERSVKDSRTYLIQSQGNSIVETPLSITKYTTEFKDLSSGRHLSNLLKQEEEDLITGGQVITDFVYDPNDYGILIEKHSHVNGSVHTIDEIYIPQNCNAGSWIPNKIEIAIITTQSGSEAPETRTTQYLYDCNSGSLIHIVSDPNSSNQVTTEIGYNIYGLPTTKTISSPGLETKISSVEYDSYKRYVTSTTNALSQASNFIYDPRWGTPIWQKGIDNNVSETFFDGYGAPIKAISPDKTIAISHKAWIQGNEISSLHPYDVANKAYYFIKSEVSDGTYSINYFDRFARLIFSEKEGFSNISYQAISFNARGNAEYITNAYDINMLTNSAGSNKIVTKFQEYDNFNRQVRSTISDGVAPPLVTTFSYSFPGNGATSVEVIDSDGKLTHRTTDAMGRLISADDNGGTLTYNYYSSGQLKTTTLIGTGVMSSREYEWGRLTKVDDKNSGITITSYNAYGLPVSQTDANNKTYLFQGYDKLDRMHVKKCPEGEYVYVYEDNGYGINQLKDITAPNGSRSVFDFDKLGRKTKKKETINGEEFLTLYKYNSKNLIEQLTYPGGFSVDYSYDGRGFMTQIKRTDNGNSIWTAGDINAAGQITHYTLGNHSESTNNFTNFGLPSSSQTPGIQNLSYIFDSKNGNMMQRKDHIRNLTEDFTYDNIDRLSTIKLNSTLISTLDYADNGNINNKSDIGDYTYGTQPNAVTQVENINGLVSNNEQSITYTSFNKVHQILEGEFKYNLAYGTNDERQSSELIDVTSNSSICKRIYLDGFEKTIKGANSYEITYINAPTGWAALYVKQNGSNSGAMYYVYTDNLGSLNTLVDENGNKIEQSFDAWGNKRNPADWTSENIPSIPEWLYRGYTGHEHLKEFSLINMNGRMYDPVIARFLSPDILLQDRTNTQNYNRYSYVLNNPLKYNDPSGWAYQGYSYRELPILNMDPPGEGESIAPQQKGYYIDGVPATHAQVQNAIRAGGTVQIPGIETYYIVKDVEGNIVGKFESPLDAAQAYNAANPDHKTKFNTSTGGFDYFDVVHDEPSNSTNSEPIDNSLSAGGNNSPIGSPNKQEIKNPIYKTDPQDAGGKNGPYKEIIDDYEKYRNLNGPPRMDGKSEVIYYWNYLDNLKGQDKLPHFNYEKLKEEEWYLHWKFTPDTIPLQILLRPNL